MIEEIMLKISEWLNFILGKLIFWKDWDNISLFLLIGGVIFVIISIIILKKLDNKEARVKNIKW